MTREIHGTVADGFEAVREEFAALVAGELADYEGQLCAYVHGRRVVDLWAGDGNDAESLYGVFSSTKGAAHLVVALLVQDGTLELDRKVTYYWPEFGVEGKAALTLRDLLAHRAGLVGLDAGFTRGELADDRVIAERLADQRPFWRPGTAFGYHALVIGALTGEVVRRATGHTLQEVYEERVRVPYGLDFFLGLPEALEPRFRSVQPMAPTPRQQAALDATPRGPHTLASIALNTHVPEPGDLMDYANSRTVRAKGPASAGGVAAARGLAGMYAAAISEVAGRPPLLKPDTVAEVGQVHSVGYDLVARMHSAFGLGFQATADAWHPFLGAGAFGHSGAAGSQAFADPRSGLAYGYTRRRCAFPGGAAPENARLVRAVHTAALAV
ncbi:MULTISPECIES: serine hydrolase domain-containing protein [unclassified Streptomyces]|uniref:serine hydrolase domain-containing protein n=1 Tax=unclassified Streptomyces TaxID=2593676 RepID=UPI00224E8357|nr:MULTISPECIES: serine hydrolase domain-containing protein [unclassified Streptomyces]MCX5047902.1 beta-lactamase family protein [Streptomyces sp. NBC_00474]MCX5057395.1 beta-lactamase family protein [Streptomyces sp. NBC_00452]MCX5245729.1 beta-lactamase family protein [Streptomyces sp. NBC_00201]MCX5288469.1 beta-lactamase family protein [Streptomyces sp. NBC_00183]